MVSEHIHFVTGRLAEHSLRQTVDSLAAELGFRYSIDVLPITVAALMTPEWIARRIYANVWRSRASLCLATARAIWIRSRRQQDYRSNAAHATCASCRRFLAASRPRPITGRTISRSLRRSTIVPRCRLAKFCATAESLAADGADIIDIGCEPSGPWSGVAEVVRALRVDGHRVSIDSLDPREIEPAVKAGAELVLSVNSSNRERPRRIGAAKSSPCRTNYDSLGGLDETIDYLASRGVRLRIDPILEPIGFGFAASLGRYLQVRERYPDAEMMMGIGNLTELTDADSAPINTLLLGFCEELEHSQRAHDASHQLGPARASANATWLGGLSTTRSGTACCRSTWSRGL